MLQDWGAWGRSYVSHGRRWQSLEGPVEAMSVWVQVLWVGEETGVTCNPPSPLSSFVEGLQMVIMWPWLSAVSCFELGTQVLGPQLSDCRDAEMAGMRTSDMSIFFSIAVTLNNHWTNGHKLKITCNSLSHGYLFMFAIKSFFNVFPSGMNFLVTSLIIFGRLKAFLIILLLEIFVFKDL